MKKILLFVFAAPLFFGSCSGPDDADLSAAQLKNKAFAQRLKAIGLFSSCSPGRIDSLVGAYGNDSINGLFLMLEKSGDMFAADMQITPANAVASYTLLFNTLARRYPEAGLKSVHVEQVLIDVNDFGRPDTSYMVTLQTKDTSYRKSVFYLTDYPADREFYVHINQLLADNKAKHRIFPVDYTCTTCPRDTFGHLPTDEKKIGLIALDNRQADSLMTMPEFGFSNNEFLVFSSHEIEQTLQKLDQSELLRNMPEAYLSKFRKDVSENFFYHKDEIYDYADTLFSGIVIDSSETLEPYTGILYTLSAISLGHFDPGDISEEHTENRSVVRFSIGDKPYAFSPVAQHGYIDPSFIDKINDVLEANEAGGYFYTVGHGQQYAEMVFIPDALISGIRSKNCFDELVKGLPEDIWRRYNGKLNVQ